MSDLAIALVVCCFMLTTCGIKVTVVDTACQKENWYKDAEFTFPERKSIPELLGLEKAE